MGLRRIFRCGGSYFVPPALPVQIVWNGVALMAATEKALYTTDEAIRAATEWDMGTVTSTVPSSLAAFATTWSNLPANAYSQINITDSGTYSSTITIPDKDFGTGGCYINFNGVQLDAQLVVGHVAGLKIDNIDFVRSGGGNAQNTCIDMTTILGVGSATKGRKVRFGSNCRFGRLWVSGKTEANLDEYSNVITCFHAEQIIFDSPKIYGVRYFGGLHAVDLLVVRKPESRQMVQSHFTCSFQYYLAQTKASTLAGGKRLAFYIQPKAWAQFNNMSVWSSAAIGTSSDVPHVDYLQLMPNDAYGIVVGSPFGAGKGITSAGRVYSHDSGTGNVTAEPTFTNGGSQAAGGHFWTYLGTADEAAFNIYILDGVMIGREDSVLATAPPSGKHTQFLMCRDSHTNQLGSPYVYEGTHITTVFAGCLNASSSTGLIAVGNTKVYSSQGTYSGPVAPANLNVSGNINPSFVDGSGITGGLVVSTNDFITGSSTGAVTIVGNKPLDTRGTASVGQRPADLMTGGFEQDGTTQNNWRVTDPTRSLLTSEATSSDALVTTARSVFKSLTSTGAQY